MHRMSIVYSCHRCVLSSLVLAALFFAYAPAQAGQQLESVNPYSAVDPFDPSETVTNTLKDDVRLRLRLPAPDLPLSVVETKQPAAKTQSASKSPQSHTQAHSQPVTEAAIEPGILGKSISTVMSIFNWSGNKEVASHSPTQEDSNEPIRINVHVGIKKPLKQPTAEIPDNEVTSLETPWARNQARVRQFFTFGEIRTHD